MDPRHSILLIDDEPGVRRAVCGFLSDQGYEALEAGGCEEGARIFLETRPDAIVLDYRLPDGDALELMERIRETDPQVPIILLTGHGSIDLAVRAVKMGAEHFFTKPVELPTLLVALQRAIEHQRTRRREVAEHSDRLRRAVDPFIGTSDSIRRLAEQASRIAGSDRPVLILGETGTGKGVLARWLHDVSGRAGAAFVDLNCSSLARELLESELFGHAKGSFTGAETQKQGLLEVAHRGTMFLDEVGDIDPAVQPKLLKVIEEMRFRRLGEVNDLRVDVRFIAATHQDLAENVRRNLFRADLYFRISTLPLRVPPLRDRADDIPVLARYLAGRLAEEIGRAEVDLSPAAVSALQTYPWPGNIRELRNVLERALLVSDARLLQARHLVFDECQPLLQEQPADAGGPSLADVERLHITKVLREEHGNVPRAAARLGISRTTLYQRIKLYRLNLRPDGS